MVMLSSKQMETLAWRGLLWPAVRALNQLYPLALNYLHTIPNHRSTTGLRLELIYPDEEMSQRRGKRLGLAA